MISHQKLLLTLSLLFISATYAADAPTPPSEIKEDTNKQSLNTKPCVPDIQKKGYYNYKCNLEQTNVMNKEQLENEPNGKNTMTVTP